MATKEQEAAYSSTRDAYLHAIRGGYNDDLRKQVRKIFSAESTIEENEDDSDYDLVVGIIEEIHAVGVHQFTIRHIKRIAVIFGLLTLTATNVLNVDKELIAALARLRISFDANQYYYTPRLLDLQNMKKRYCTDEKLEHRMQGFSNRKIQT